MAGPWLAGHQQISDSRKTNRALGLAAGNLLVDTSYGWWQDKHLRHHANPNHEGLDPDVGEGVIAWSGEQAAKTIAFILIHRGLYGLNLGSAFAPDHKGMQMPLAGSRMNHLRKQVLTSRDVTGGPVVDFLLGGVNYQIEHHLFPSMPRPHLKLAQPIIRDYCNSIGPPYRACGPIESYGECLAYLRKAGSVEHR